MINHLSVNVLCFKNYSIRQSIVYETTTHVQVLQYPLAHGGASDRVVKGKIQMLFHMIKHGREPTRIPPICVTRHFGEWNSLHKMEQEKQKTLLPRRCAALCWVAEHQGHPPMDQTLSQVVWAGAKPGVAVVTGYFVNFAVANLLESVPANTDKVPQIFGVEERHLAVHGHLPDQENNVGKLPLDLLPHFNE